MYVIFTNKHAHIMETFPFRIPHVRSMIIGAQIVMGVANRTGQF